jgi:PHS family inorganic phosphate transporter-like MFS transporter
MPIGQGSNEVLTALDKAKTQWYHFTTIIIAGMGFFTDAYDLFCISTVTRLLGRIYYFDPTSSKPGSLPPNVSAAVNGVALCGTLCGQLFFGWLGDRLGRKKVYGYTLLLMIITSLASGLSFGHTAKGVMTTLCFFRFWLGFGVGGDYPLSATIMSEYANKRTRGAFIAAVFAMQGFGILAGATVSLIVSAAFKAAYPAHSYTANPAGSTPPQSDYVWRIVFMFGAFPAATTFYWRMKMPETARYTALIAKNSKRAALDMGRVLHVDFSNVSEAPVNQTKGFNDEYGLFSKKFARRHGLQLLGTTTTWFLLDIAFYSQNLFQKDIFTAVGWLPPGKTMSALQEMFKVSKTQALIALCSTVPGYWFTVAFVDHIGRWIIQLGGFFMMTFFMLILTFDYYNLRGQPCASNPNDFCGGHHVAFIVCYAFTFFFSTFGPNATTFIVPAELFPARLRSTCHGISAAAGKAGAIVGAFGFQYAAESQHQGQQDKGYPTGIGLKRTFLALSIISLAGFVMTFFVPETNQRSLEDLSGENDVDDDSLVTEKPAASVQQGVAKPVA